TAWMAAPSDNRCVGAMPAVLPPAQGSPGKLSSGSPAGTGARYSRNHANPSYTGTPGFNVDLGDIATPRSVPDPTRALRENHELIQDLCRYAENLASESAIRRRWRLSEETWEALGADDELVRAIEDEKTRRIRSGATKRELAQQHIVRGPLVLAGIMDSPT